MANFTAGLTIAVEGILIVFSVLVILMLVLYIMKLFAKDESKAPATSNAVAAPVAAAPVENADSDETIAVISAAVAAMSGSDPTRRLRVVSITKQGSNVPMWTSRK